jgi:hypothetical protein
LARGGSHIDGVDDDRKRHRLGNGSTKRFVLIRGTTSQLMIEVRNTCHTQITLTLHLEQQMQERD